MLGTRTLSKAGVMMRWLGPLGRCVRSNVSYHTWWCLVWSCSGYNAMYNAIWGMYNAVSMVKLIAYS